MQQLNRSMMERYEIPDTRPEALRALILGADALMLGGVARALDQAGVGAICATSKADALAPQDGMFTLLVRGENLDGKRVKEEKVVQSILKTVDAGDTDAILARAGDIEMIFCHAGNAQELALTALVTKARLDLNLAAPRILLVSDMPCEASPIGQRVLAETLCGSLNEEETAIARREMNYRDDFIAWAEPFLRLTVEGEVPECIAGACSGMDYDTTCDQKSRVFDAAVAMCAAAGYLAGKNSFADVLKDEAMRSWIGHSFFDELLPILPYGKDEIAPQVISAFERLENPMNAMPLLEVGRDLLSSASRTLLPSIRAYADEAFEAPIGLTFALAALIMLYAGAREEDGVYKVCRGDQTDILHDDAEVLEPFSRLSHDMPAETLAYAVLADRSIWGCDLRDIDGLEMRLTYDLSAIQRIGFKEALKLKVLEWEE